LIPLLLTIVEYGYDQLGFNVAFFILGAAGGFVRSITKDNVGLRHGLINIFVGGIFAAYGTPFLIFKFTIKAKEEVFAIALCMGFLVMGIFAVWNKIEIWARNNPKLFISIIANWLFSVAKRLGAGGTNGPGTNRDNNESDTPPIT
jgi:uncharacterized membrane protein